MCSFDGTVRAKGAEGGPPVAVTARRVHEDDAWIDTVAGTTPRWLVAIVATVAQPWVVVRWMSTFCGSPCGSRPQMWTVPARLRDATRGKVKAASTVFGFAVASVAGRR